MTRTYSARAELCPVKPGITVGGYPCRQPRDANTEGSSTCPLHHPLPGVFHVLTMVGPKSV